MTRFMKCSDFYNLILGKDNDGIFEDDIIYTAKRIMGEIILTPVGLSSIKSTEGWRKNITDIIGEGNHLSTQEEYIKNLQNLI